ncbi:MAG: hypothetical protein WEF53_10845, partial [Bacteroidota bacterium]
RFQVSGFRFQVSGFRFQVQGLGSKALLVLGLQFWFLVIGYGFCFEHELQPETTTRNYQLRTLFPHPSPIPSSATADSPARLLETSASQPPP